MLRHAASNGIHRKPANEARSLTTPGSPIPVTIVCGFLGAGKTTLIRFWLDQRPPGQRWVVLQNERGSQSLDALAAALGPDGVRLIDLSAACACCVAEPAMRRELPRLARAGCDRLIIELSGQAQPHRVADLLRSPPLADLFDIERIVSVVGAERASIFGRLDDPQAPALAQALATAQIEVADQVWWRRNDCPSGAADRLQRSTDASARVPALADAPDDADDDSAALRRVLANWPPFGRPILTDLSALAEHRRFGACAPVVDAFIGAEPGWHRRVWRWPARTHLSRAGFVTAVERARATATGPWRLHALLKTERETYEWRLDADNSHSLEEAATGLVAKVCAYRSESRVELSWKATPSPAWVMEMVDALNALA